MSDTFTFKTNTIFLTLSGNSYELPLNEDTVAICDNIRSEAKAYLSRLNDESTNADTAISDICRFFEGCIDRLLGENVTKEIFGKRPIKLLDLTDLFCFILSKIGSAVAARILDKEED